MPYISSWSVGCTLQNQEIISFIPKLINIQAFETADNPSRTLLIVSGYEKIAHPQHSL